MAPKLGLPPSGLSQGGPWGCGSRKWAQAKATRGPTLTTTFPAVGPVPAEPPPPPCVSPVVELQLIVRVGLRSG